MRSKFWILLLSIQWLAFTAAAQNPAKRQIVLPVSNGGFVAFRSETPGSKGAPSLASLLYSQAFAGENRIIHRVLTDAEQNTKIATAVIYVAIGATIASLISSVARSAVRSRRANPPMAGS